MFFTHHCFIFGDSVNSSIMIIRMTKFLPIGQRHDCPTKGNLVLLLVVVIIAACIVYVEAAGDARTPVVEYGVDIVSGMIGFYKRGSSCRRCHDHAQIFVYPFFYSKQLSFLV